MSLLLKLVVVVCSASSLLARNVNVDVKAPWQPHIVSFIAEYSEFVFDHSPEYFWKYASDVCAISAKVDEVMEKKDIDVVNEVQSLVSASAMKQVPKPFYSLMDTMIGLGNFLPAIQFFQSLADKFNDPCNGEPFVVLYPGEVILCSAVEDLQSQFDRLEGAKIEIVGSNAAWDHVYNFNGKSTKAVLYGTLGTSSFCSLHNWLVSHPLVSSGEVQYSARHAFFDNSLTPDASGFTRLQGYGVYLDIKNMEYKNVDDSANGEGGGDSAATDSKESEDMVISFAEEEEVAGINFSKLYASLPDAGNELVMLREELKKAQSSSEEGSIEDMKLKIWKMKDLGLQTIQMIYSAGVQSTAAAAVEKFADIAQNFPRLASLVSSTKVSPSVRRDVERLTESGVLHALPTNSLYINGKRTDLGGNTFNIFDLLEEVQEELLLQGKLSSLKLDRTTKKALVSVANNVGGATTGDAAAFGGPIQRVDVSRGGKFVVHFLNNLEKDPQYRVWPSSLKQLLYPSWSLHTIAKNLYTLISVVDPMSVEGATILMQVQMFLQQYPIRFGVVLSCSGSADATPSSVVSADGSSESSEWATSEDFCRLYAHTRASYDASFSTAFLFAVTEAVYEAYNVAQASGQADPSGRIARSQLVDIYTNIIATLSEAWTSASYTAEAQEVLRAQSHSDYLRNTSLYLEARGLPVNSYSLNGIVVNDINLQSSLMQIISREQYIMTQYYQKRIITDKSKSIYADIMNHTEAFARYHPMLDDKNIQYADFNTPAGQQLLSRLSFANPLLSQDITAASLPHYELANSTVLVAPLTVAGYQAASTAIEWLLHNHDKIAAAITSTVDGGSNNNHRLAIVHSVSSSADLDEASAARAAEVLHLLRLVEEGMSVPVGEAASVCDFECLKALVMVYRMLEDSLSLAEMTDRLTGYLKQQLPALEAHRGVATIDRLKRTHTAADLEAALSAARQKFSFAKEVLAVDAGDILISYNARRLDVPVPASPSKRPLHELDLDLLVSLEQARLTAALTPLLDKMRSSSAVSLAEANPALLLSRYDTHSNVLLKLSSYCGFYNSQSGKRYDINGLLDRLYSESFEAVLFSLEPDMSDFSESSDDLKIVWVIDPLTLAGQRAASIIKLIRDHLHYSQTILFTPRMDISSFPLQNFYRYVLSPHDSHKAVASFTQLPRQHVLTARVDIPEPWNVQTSAAMQDIDNLRCIGSVCGDPNSKKKDLTEISYALKNLLVSGQCFQSVPGDPSQTKIGLPPNGLQLTLTPAQSYFRHLRAQSEGSSYALTDRTDTLVMQNLGYYQLQANPGLFVLDLAEGKATDLYTIKKAEPFGQFVAVRSFGDVLHRLIVSKRPGMENIPLIETDNSPDAMTNPFFEDEEEEQGEEKKEGSEGEAGSMWSSLKSSLFGASDKTAKPAGATAVKPAASSADEDDTLHVFSLATGHMYERLLRIMMLSVTRHSSKPVKFWLFENYLSPTFKAIADEMAKEYGFQVGYVTYKWPQWLTQQTQQQRIIWGYKILFLDVLFPLNVKKVIYVDADQVVRADLKELWDMDLKGKPYAYTPFCTSRQETLGFQFWRQGYWKDHLQGKPYHISALYVVDLQKFRKNAVGDSLRAIYDNLSRDPNSLANLDQDLPNYAQHQVPIHSLPQEWLWCETWCSDDSKKKAKTIDLCNNPLHKEPKLDMARRVISGELFNQSWVSLDNEIRELELRKGFITSE